MEAAEREFFRTIREAIFSNPFSATRLELDRAASGSPTAPLPEILKRLMEKVGNTIGKLEARIDPRTLSAEDGLLLSYAKLFYTFHVFCDDYDAHIQEQVRQGDDCCPVPFAPDLLGMLSRQGFAAADARRFLALFFQMRRAFFFIQAITGKSQCVMDLRRALWNNVFTGDIALYDKYLLNNMEDFSTMILGETGTGKGMAAAAIGRSGFIPYNEKSNTFSESFARAFVSINLSQYPEQLLESELFGHKKGAFTGAVEAHHGIFARCSPCGAIFLDEIGDVAVPVQIKLLQVLQERFFTPVGSHKREKFQGRVIAATNKNLTKLREDGDFRDDFYYRLCSDVIEVPPLRKRLAENPDELKELIKVVLKRIIGRDSEELADKSCKYIQENQPEDYPWPGNIRELEQCVRRLLLNNSYDWQQNRQSHDPAERLVAGINNGKLTAQQLLVHYCRQLYAKDGTYEGVARITDLDRRTVKKYIQVEVDGDLF